jgi:hypothetical protein
MASPLLPLKLKFIQGPLKIFPNSLSPSVAPPNISGATLQMCQLSLVTSLPGDLPPLLVPLHPASS